ncbi:hypothetical protein [Alkalihalobacillus sp. 1P02AB]|uniref:hypothetical protein n=1 Tax=Alkalihalobacillus sp. 1P02AB TaxID=3132260 RepID=UPI0039A6334C
MEHLNQNRTIPLFDCDYEQFDQHLEFYTALGFEITYYQKVPYRFASVVHSIAEFGFYGANKKKETINVGGCSIVVPNVREVYHELRANLKQHYGKIPSKGIPRISRLNETVEDWRFNITDPNGNYIIICEAKGDSATLMETEEERVKHLSKFEKLYKQAYRLAYSKEDFRAARNLLEAAFKRHGEELSPELVIRGKVLQVDVLNELSELAKAKEILKQLDDLQVAI